MTDALPDSLIPYDEIVQEALRAVVGRVLGQIGHSDMLPGAHHFYITFKTQAAGVDIPQHLVARFPDEMTVVLQNKFWELKVHDDAFEVGLTFNGIAARLYIPFASITAFHDPAVNFALQFNVASDGDAPSPHEAAHNDAPRAAPVKHAPVEDGSNVVAIDFKRKK